MGKFMLRTGKKFSYHIGIVCVTCPNLLKTDIWTGAMKSLGRTLQRSILLLATVWHPSSWRCPHWVEQPLAFSRTHVLCPLAGYPGDHIQEPAKPETQLAEVAVKHVPWLQLSSPPELIYITESIMYSLRLLLGLPVALTWLIPAAVPPPLTN